MHGTKKFSKCFGTYPRRDRAGSRKRHDLRGKAVHFSVLTRTYCEMAGGICPEDYARYRIDDHIYNVFNLLAVLGKNASSICRKSCSNTPTPARAPARTVCAGSGNSRRRHAALRPLAGRTGKSWQSGWPERSTGIFERTGGHAPKTPGPDRRFGRLRRPEFVTVRGAASPLSSETRGSPSASCRRTSATPHAKTCLDAIKQHTANYDLVVLDNNFGPGFNHSREMNRILSICRTDFLVLMDDDVFRQAGVAG